MSPGSVASSRLAESAALALGWRRFVTGGTVLDISSLASCVITGFSVAPHCLWHNAVLDL